VSSTPPLLHTPFGGGPPHQMGCHLSPSHHRGVPKKVVKLPPWWSVNPWRKNFSPAPKKDRKKLGPLKKSSPWGRNKLPQCPKFSPIPRPELPRPGKSPGTKDNSADLGKAFTIGHQGVMYPIPDLPTNPGTQKIFGKDKVNPGV